MTLGVGLILSNIEYKSHIKRKFESGNIFRLN